MFLRRLIATLVVFGAFALVATLLFGAFLVVAAIFAAIGGLGFFVTKIVSARALWKSHGRFDVGDATRLIGAGRARAFAMTELVQGAGGLALSLVPAWVFFQGTRPLVIPFLAAGLLAVLASGVARRRLAAGSKPVDILPPE